MSEFIHSSVSKVSIWISEKSLKLATAINIGKQNFRLSDSDNCLVDSIYLLDFRNAFDKVSHHYLLSKLSHFGIQEVTLSLWHTGTNRKQLVSINGAHLSVDLSCSWFTPMITQILSLHVKISSFLLMMLNAVNLSRQSLIILVFSYVLATY